MRDLMLFLILAGLAGVTLYRPWIGVLCLSVVAYLQPQGYAFGAMAEFPAFKVILAALVAGLFLSPSTRSLSFYRKRLEVFRDWRLLILGLLWLQCLLSTTNSWLPSVAWPKFIDITKIFLTLGFTLLLIDTKDKLCWLAITIALSIGLVSLKGGFWAVITGSLDRVYGPPNSQYYDNNHFAVLNVMNVPLLIFWLGQSRGAAMKMLVGALIALSLMAALTSWSRGGLLALGITVLLIAWHRRSHKLIFAGLLVTTTLILLSLLPIGWFERMETLTAYQQDASAIGRLNAWEHGIAYALHNPLLGAGPDGWVYTAGIAWHSAYVTMLAEHGFPGLILWGSLLAGTLMGLWRTKRLAAQQPGGRWAADLAGMLQASLAGYAVGAAFLQLAYWDILYHLVAISVVLSAMVSVNALPSAEPEKQS